jgi:hypothetical protein
VGSIDLGTGTCGGKLHPTSVNLWRAKVLEEASVR